MPGRLNESTRTLISSVETNGSAELPVNRRWSSPIREHSPDNISIRSLFDSTDPLGLVSLFSQYSVTDGNEEQVSLETPGIIEMVETVDPSLFHNESTVEGPSETDSSGLYTSLASSLNLLRRREMRLREMRARVDGMAERLSLMREVRSMANWVSPVRVLSSSSPASFSTVSSPGNMTWPSGISRNILRGTWLPSDAFLDANGDTWTNNRISELDDSSDIHYTTYRNLRAGSEYFSPSILSSYRIIDGVLFNLDGEEVGHVAALDAELRSCKELYDEMIMHNLFPCDRNDDGSLYFYSTIAHNKSNQRRRKHSVDLCAGR
ncbi:hypothetical protein PCANB_000362 [Pneumocystis canis]|nr:hypothetical protein PCK1_000268 [Pneumocystis canis]KAG5438015.1 hypothetical protein PCANB_000362 [Pneumocystis canis]